MGAAAAISFLLLVYVGFGEASRTFPKFLVEKMAAQAELLKIPLEAHLRAGLPYAQFPGFRQIADRLRESDPSLAAVVAADRIGTAVFASGETDMAMAVGAPWPPRSMLVRQDGTWLQVWLPLNDRFEMVGALGIAMRQAGIAVAIGQSFAPIAGAALVLAGLVGIIAIVRGPAVRSGEWPWLGMSYLVSFVLLSALVLGALVSIYSAGAQSKARALADSLAQRLEPVVAYGLRLEDFGGLDTLSHEYRRLDPDIGTIAIVSHGIVVQHTDPRLVGQAFRSAADSYIFARQVSGDLEVAVSVPTAVVRSAVLRSAKNFAALFVAVALLSALSLRVATAVSKPRSNLSGEFPAPAGVLQVLTAVFFLSVFVESLSAGFLPQLMRASAATAGYGGASASLAFTVYFLGFLLVLVPGPHWATRYGERALIQFGALLACAGYLLIGLDETFGVLVAARALAGIGQGLLLAGTQSFVILRAPPQRRTQAAALIVFGFNGGMIAGTAIGSLLVNYIEPRGVFFVGAAVAAAVALTSAALLPSTPGQRSAGEGFSVVGQFARNSLRALRNLHFLRTMFLVGLPSKAVLTGIVAFSLPLTLANLGYAPEDIGQLVMLYPGGVLLASGWVSRRVDAFGGGGRMLVIGMVLSGLGMMVVGAGGGAEEFAGATTALIATGVLLLGLSHGFINAPVITHVAQGDLAQAIGGAQAAGLYRILERAGHVAGPALAGQMLLATGSGPAAIGVAGLAALVLGLVFWLPFDGKHAAQRSA